MHAYEERHSLQALLATAAGPTLSDTNIKDKHPPDFFEIAAFFFPGRGRKKSRKNNSDIWQTQSGFKLTTGLLK